MADINSVQNLLTRISNYRYNPAGIQKEVLGMLKEITDGQVDIVDPTNPVVFTLEAAATLASAAMTHNKVLTRKQYPFSAQTIEELYPHMSDKDYVDRFAVPASTKIFFIFGKEELYNRLVQDDTNPGIRKIIIPRNTYVTVGETTFSLQYPIEIRQMAHGGLQIVYDAEITSPLKTLSTNVIDWTVIRTDEGQELIGFEVEMDQFSIVSRSAPLNVSTAFVATVDFDQQFYYCRVWVDNGDGTFTEMKTTHTDEIYDPATLTAVLKVLDGRVVVKIPQIYISNGLTDKTLRIDVYQTKGPVTLDLSNYPPNQFEAKFVSLNKTEKNKFVSPLSSFNTLFVYSRKFVSGGTNAMSFEDLRLRVIRNAIGVPDLPITNVQVEESLTRAGYRVVKNIDNITNRQFLASRPMPDPIDSELITAAAAGIGTLATTEAKAVLLDTVVDNGDIVTITPQTLYRIKSGVLELVPTAEVAALRAMSVDKLAIAATNGNYFYSPFHYVMDASGATFDLRAYYLDNPEVVSKSFIGENDTTLYQVGIGGYQVMRTDTGYKVRIQTKSSDAWKQIPDAEAFVQLAFLPKGEIQRAYVMGVLVGTDANTNEKVFDFDLPTNYRINKSNELSMLSFKMFDTSDRVVNMPLDVTFDFLFSTSIAMPPAWQLSVIDSRLGSFMLPPNTRAITHEQLNMKFGSHLAHLWTRSRSVVSEAEYERWATDVPAIYEKDVFDIDPATGSGFSVNNGQLTYNYLHRAGDPVLDSQGNQVYKHRAGDVKLDSYGNPVVVKNRDMLRQMDLMIVEGTYFFATNQVAIEYRKLLVESVVSWITEDLPTMGDNLLEKTDIFFYPTTTIGSVDVMFGSGLTTTLNAGQFFQLALYITSSVDGNDDLKAEISRKSIKTIGEGLTKSTISISDITDALREQYKDDVISIELKGLGGTSNLNVLTMVDNSQRMSIRKKLVARNDQTLALVEDVTIEFVRHERDNTVVVR